jgi:hypothetical protein
MEESMQRTEDLEQTLKQRVQDDVARLDQGSEQLDERQAIANLKDALDKLLAIVNQLRGTLMMSPSHTYKQAQQLVTKALGTMLQSCDAAISEERFTAKLSRRMDVLRAASMLTDDQEHGHVERLEARNHRQQQTREAYAALQVDGRVEQAPLGLTVVILLSVNSAHT